jgi:ethanolamine utilization cobalamin adenosyltransferase
VKIITEIDLRKEYKIYPFESYWLEPGVRLTPAAIEFMNERKIKIIDETGEPILGSQHKRGLDETRQETGIRGKEKPEEFTHLRGTTLVLKTHERIRFRGKLDSLQAFLISLIIEIQQAGHSQLASELQLILEYLRKMMLAEVTEKPLAFILFNGWQDSEIRERSHHPKEYYGIGHFTPDPSQGPVMAGLNQLRTKVRELEIMGVAAFHDLDSKGLPRKDIVLALNRLSSLVYIMMCQYLGGEYGQQKAGNQQEKI